MVEIKHNTSFSKPTPQIIMTRIRKTAMIHLANVHPQYMHQLSYSGLTITETRRISVFNTTDQEWR